MNPQPEITKLLLGLNVDKRRALNELLPVVYQELRRIADSYMRRQDAHHTLQPTALLHEAYLRLAASDNHNYRDRTHFFAVAAAVMRNILVDHARARHAGKRGGGRTLLPLHEEMARTSDRADLIALDHALAALARLDERKAKVLELRIFAGLSVEECGRVMGLSVATVGRETRFAEAWLRREILGR